MTVATAVQLLDVRTLPRSRETLAYRDGGQFPVLATTAEGILIAALRGGAGHLGLAGRLDVIRSLDAGNSWTPPQVVADSERDDRNPAMGVANDGTIVLAYHCQGSYDQQGTYTPGAESDGVPRVSIMVTRSADNGLTWTEPELLDAEPVRYGSPFGKIVALADGTLLLPIYVHHRSDETPALPDGGEAPPDGSYIIRSTDGGKTWHTPTCITAGTNETALLVLPNDHVIAAVRGSNADQALWITHSGDSGRTWSPPQQITGARRHPADLALLANGDVLLTYGNRNPPYRIEGIISHDRGQTWRDDLLLTFSGPLYGHTGERPTDLGYPSNALHQGQGTTIYYYNPFPLTEAAEWRQGGTAAGFYQARGYRAVSVNWDETELIEAISHA